ncbi:hypothetical protein [Sulfuricurvum sp.]|uniref:hypothetical protein n=1 Tax=Sulfuricurvum sp. TaxID=2025608 RepID=UPI0019C8B04F|nr:hypothetical protein [Sulfuricurvum sp.]MBD3806459.1 hypothetical protein [Sulfuricurvum sp.]
MKWFNVFRLAETLSIELQALCARMAKISPRFCTPQYVSYGRVDDRKGSIVVLTPEDYWAKRTELNVSTEKEAARYGYSLFDFDEEFVCYARNVGGRTYDIIAFHPNKIIEKYPELFLEGTSHSVTFAQWVFADLDHPIQLQNGKYLSLHEGIVFEIDGHYVDTTHTMNIEEIENRSYHRLKTVLMDAIIPSNLTTKTVKTTLFVLILLSASLVIEGYRWHMASEEIRQEMERLSSSSGLQGVATERKAILDTLKHKEAKQLKLRDRCYALRDIPLNPIISDPIPNTPSVEPLANPQSGVVLIPGSKPGEPNRLLVNGIQNTPTSSVRVNEGIREIVYDGKQMLISIESTDLINLKRGLVKTFRNSRIEEQNGRLEVRLK